MYARPGACALSFSPYSFFPYHKIGSDVRRTPRLTCGQALRQPRIGHGRAPDRQGDWRRISHGDDYRVDSLFLAKTMTKPPPVSLVLVRTAPAAGTHDDPILQTDAPPLVTSGHNAGNHTPCYDDLARQLVYPLVVLFMVVRQLGRPESSAWPSSCPLILRLDLGDTPETAVGQKMPAIRR
jgi:hypothetical protein